MNKSVRLRWFIGLATLASMALTAKLGFWQLQRAQDKINRASLIAQRMGEADWPASELAKAPEDLPQQLHRSVRVTGTWLAQHTVHLENRQMNGRPGFITLTPLLLSDGTAVLVQRGWQPRHRLDRTQVQTPFSPPQTIVLHGRIASPPSQLFDFNNHPAATTEHPPIRLNIEPRAFAQEIKHPLRPLSLLQLEPEHICSSDHLCQPAADQPLLRQLADPAQNSSKHHGYAFQWFALCTLIAGLFIWFQIIQPLRRHANSVRCQL